jgi:hypothetical protein
MPTGVFRQSKHQRSAAFNVRIAEGRKPSGIPIADIPDGSRCAATSIRQVSGRAQALVSFLSTLRHPLRILDSVGAGDPTCSWNAGVATQIDRPQMLDIEPEPDRVAFCFEPVPSPDRRRPHRGQARSYSLGWDST